MARSYDDWKCDDGYEGSEEQIVADHAERGRQWHMERERRNAERLRLDLAHQAGRCAPDCSACSLDRQVDAWIAERAQPITPKGA